MKKLALRLGLAVLVLLILAILVIGLFLDAAVRRGIITVGPMLTKVDIQLKSVSLSLLSGSGTLKGLVVGNPEGYKSPSSIQVGSATLALQPMSILADKIVIKS